MRPEIARAGSVEEKRPTILPIQPQVRPGLAGPAPCNSPETGLTAGVTWRHLSCDVSPDKRAAASSWPRRPPRGARARSYVRCWHGAPPGLQLLRVVASRAAFRETTKRWWWWRRRCRQGARTVSGMAGRGEGNGAATMAGVATGGVEDAYGEDRATEDQPITPWAVCVARYAWLVPCDLLFLRRDKMVLHVCMRHLKKLCQRIRLSVLN